MKKSILAGSAVVALGLALSAAPAAQATACGTPSFYVNDDSHNIVNYSATGAVLSTVPYSSSFLNEGYGDIALSLDHATVYGVFNDETNDFDVLNASTGAVTSTVTLTGDAAFIGGWVGAAILPDGQLAIGSAGNSSIYKVNVSDGTSTVWVDMADADSHIVSTAGDFALLPDGDELALGRLDNDEQYSAVVRIHNNVPTVVGKLPAAWGAGRVGDSIFVAGADGKIYRADNIPTAAGDAVLTTTVVKDTALNESLWGGAGTQDGETGSCPLPSASSKKKLANTGSNSDALELGLGFAAAGALALAFAARRRNA
ncbi:MAG: hypothetical protein RL556_644 [Actinomycetota bacterium]